MYEIAVNCTFNATHAVTVGGVQEELHDHDWRVVATVAGESLDEEGLLIDFLELQRLLNAAVSPMRWRPTSAWRIAAAVAMLLLGTYTVIWTMNGTETVIDEALVDAAVLDELEQAQPIDGTFASQRQIERDYVAYFDKQQNRFYLVEVDHEWTAIQTVSSEL